MTTNLDLLRQIQEGSLSTGTPVSELLRRCQVLAARVQLPELGDWVRHELNGYPDDSQLPDYRIMHGIARGHFLGPGGSGLRNAVLPAGNLPKEYRDWATKAYIRQPIAMLEQIASGKKNDVVTVQWPGDLIARVHDRFYEYLSLGQAWLSISRGDFVGAVEAVRNRILSFSLDAEPHIKRDESSPAPASQVALSHVFNTNIYGSVGNLAQGSSQFTQSTSFPAGDIAILLKEIRQLGVPEDGLGELKTAIEQDGPIQNRTIGKRVAGWIGDGVTKAISGVWGVATSTATTILPKLIKQYYNIPD